VGLKVLVVYIINEFISIEQFSVVCLCSVNILLR